MKRVIFTVTNDLSYDQRIIRICTSMAQNGYSVTLVGARLKQSLPLQSRNFKQKRLFTPFGKGFGFYAGYNISLFFYLLFSKAEIVCCIDTDTMLPVWLASSIKNCTRVYDAHEYFSQQKEIISRPRIYRVWHAIEKRFIPKFKNGYTVSESIADAFKELYAVQYSVIRNMPLLQETTASGPVKERYILYQGAVNEARGLEFLIPAMKQVDAQLLIYGDGNFMAQTKALINENNLRDKVLCKGKLMPEELEKITALAYIGINLVENNGLNQYYSLANKFFDYIHAGVPQLSMNFPEYRRINEQYEVAWLVDDLQTDTLVNALNQLMKDESLHQRLKQQCEAARRVFNWQEEEKTLIRFYNNLEQQ